MRRCSKRPMRCINTTVITMRTTTNMCVRVVISCCISFSIVWTSEEGTSRGTTCATRAETASSGGVEDGQTSVNLADVRLILFYSLRKKCRIPRISNDESRKSSIVSEEVSPSTDPNLRKGSSYSHSDCSSDSWWRPCALRCIRQKPLPITNHGGFGTRPPTDARARAHLTESGHRRCRNDLVRSVTHATDSRCGICGGSCRRCAAKTQHVLRHRQFGSTVPAILTPSNAR